MTFTIDNDRDFNLGVALLNDGHPIPEWAPQGDELYRRGYGRGLVITGAHVPDAVITTLHGYRVPCEDMVHAIHRLMDIAVMCGLHQEPSTLLAEAVDLYRAERYERVIADLEELRAIGGVDMNGRRTFKRTVGAAA